MSLPYPPCTIKTIVPPDIKKSAIFFPRNKNPLIFLSLEREWMILFNLYGNISCPSKIRECIRIVSPIIPNNKQKWKNIEHSISTILFVQILFWFMKLFKTINTDTKFTFYTSFHYRFAVLTSASLFFVFFLQNNFFHLIFLFRRAFAWWSFWGKNISAQRS